MDFSGGTRVLLEILCRDGGHAPANFLGPFALGDLKRLGMVAGLFIAIFNADAFAISAMPPNPSWATLLTFTSFLTMAGPVA